MEPDLTIAKAVIADLAAVERIYTPYVTDTVITFEENPPTVDDWRAKLDDLTARGLPFLVARVGGRVAGYAYAGPWRPKPAYRHTVEDSIYLAPGYGGRGIGSALLRALLDQCARAGARQVIAVITDAGGDASHALHRRLGFREAGRLGGVGFKHGRWVGTVLMQRGLDEES
ncbi:N-acetyltransferase family protein [Dactylosporangium sp. CA-233914]|uniref:GNAT family N-acetyltransferase n=1 Tax=Dactylosporangium sp. CA-233914 TaxID=3239934 RepID=UPI003D8E0E85